MQQGAVVDSQSSACQASGLCCCLAVWHSSCCCALGPTMSFCARTIEWPVFDVYSSGFNSFEFCGLLRQPLDPVVMMPAGHICTASVRYMVDVDAHLPLTKPNAFTHSVHAHQQHAGGLPPVVID
jgi:hypothetical protein